MFLGHVAAESNGKPCISGSTPRRLALGGGTGVAETVADHDMDYDSGVGVGRG